MTIMIAQMNGLVDCLTGFERILRTPIPLAYSIHLSQTVWAYCLALPFQLVDALGWVTIPMVCIASFTLFGIESIGGEIENPFGYDTNDLPLDDFCEVIKKEQDMITSIPPPSVDAWVGSMDSSQPASEPVKNVVKEAEAAVRKERDEKK
jgi:putative membrane protein